jgi:hypothetical protein
MPNGIEQLRYQRGDARSLEFSGEKVLESIRANAQQFMLHHFAGTDDRAYACLCPTRHP